MDSLQLLMNGFATVFDPVNLLFAVIGCVLGTLVGILPGIGPGATMALLIPVTFVLDPTPAIIMLAAIYDGAAYGGTISAVLINTPGEASGAVTVLDGHQMAKQGRAGAALSISAIGSFIGGTVSTFGLVLLAAPITAAALTFGPPEFFALIVLALTLVTALAGRSLVRGMIVAAIGLLIGMIGLAPVVGAPRVTLGRVELLDGVNFVVVVMGMFGISEVLLNIERPARGIFRAPVSSLWLTRQDLRRSAMPIVRGTGIGFTVGMIPGVGESIASFMSYIAEKKVSKHPELLGTGDIAGVAGPETANNACANASMIPMFTLGIPGSIATAVLMGAFMINGLTPGPTLFTNHPDFVWAVIASFYVGNVILLVLNLPLIPVWTSLLRIPYSILFALILVFTVVGAYGLRSNPFDIGLMVVFGLLGFVLRKLDFPLMPMVLTLVLGPMMERALRQSLDMSQGGFGIFVERPISAVLLAIAAVVVISVAAGIFRGRKAREATSDA